MVLNKDNAGCFLSFTVKIPVKFIKFVFITLSKSIPKFANFDQFVLIYHVQNSLLELILYGF